jgi:hypothetical protein
MPSERIIVQVFAISLIEASGPKDSVAMPAYPEVGTGDHPAKSNFRMPTNR